MSKSNQSIVEVIDKEPLSRVEEKALSNQNFESVKAQMVAAKNYPRDEEEAYHRIIIACRRRTLAKNSMYSYPKGGATVTGPSIRLAEVLARCWRNIDYGIVTLKQKPNESIMLAYAWDLEANVRVTKIFPVRHELKAYGKTKALDDARDIYEHTANLATRRLRACLLAVIPQELQEDALLECEATLRGESQEPLGDRVKKMVVAFGCGLGVSRLQIEARLGHTLGTTSETELVQLRGIYSSLQDSNSKSSAWFDSEVRGENGRPETETYPVDDGRPTDEELAADEKALSEGVPVALKKKKKAGK